MAEAALINTGAGIGAILSVGDRDCFLVRNSVEQVKISSIDASIVGVYFSASWCQPCSQFTPKLIQVYKELASQGKSFEVVFVSADDNEEAFNGYFAKMPWLAVPFSDSEGRKGLNDRFEVSFIPLLVILDPKTGEVYTKDGVQFVNEYGVEAYPFTLERIDELEEQEKEAKDNQTIQSVLGTATRDYVITNQGDKVPIAYLEEKYVGLYFVVSGSVPIDDFTAVLAKVYQKLKEAGEEFEVVVVSLDDDESLFNENFGNMPCWLAIPQGDNMCEKLARYFEVTTLPAVVLIGPDGKTMNSNVADIIEEHGFDAWEGFPFGAEKVEVLADMAKAKAASQTLESLLVSGDLDFVIGKHGAKVPVPEIVGKTVLLYFSAKWCAPCRAFLSALVNDYNKIKQKNPDFEIVFVSDDEDQSSFEEFFSDMPWLALPFEDERKLFLDRTFRIRGFPSMVAIGPTGKTVCKDANFLLMTHGADAFPFTKERVEELQRKQEHWPETLVHDLHDEHELVLTHQQAYLCDGCEALGSAWSYRCDQCEFDLHPKCALVGDEEKRREEEEEGNAAVETIVGYVCECEGDVCRKA